MRENAVNLYRLGHRTLRKSLAEIVLFLQISNSHQEQSQSPAT